MIHVFTAVAAMTLMLQAVPPAAAAKRTAASYVRLEDYRIARVGYRLGLFGLRYCKDAHPLTGLLLHHLAEYETRDRSTVIAAYGLDRGPGVLAVIEDGPAARAGLVAGDVLLAVNGKAFPAPLAMAKKDDSRNARLAIEGSERQLENQLKEGPARLTITRDGQERVIPLAPIPGCLARIRLARSGQMNAFANRGYAIMTTALFNFAQSDDEIAIILGHEIAHNILRHPETLEAEGVPKGGFFRHFGKNAAKVRATEEEADRLGIRLAWAAGYDVSAAIPFWRRYSAQVGPRLRTTHPGLRAREELITETIMTLGRSELGAQRPELGEGALPER